jgi:hypothetical protein
MVVRYGANMWCNSRGNYPDLRNIQPDNKGDGSGTWPTLEVGGSGYGPYSRREGGGSAFYVRSLNPGDGKSAKQ